MAATFISGGYHRRYDGCCAADDDRTSGGSDHRTARTDRGRTRHPASLDRRIGTTQPTSVSATKKMTPQRYSTTTFLAAVALTAFSGTQQASPSDPRLDVTTAHASQLERATPGPTVSAKDSAELANSNLRLG